MTKKLPKVALWTIEALNEYAALIDAGQDLPNHTPASPMFWFAGLAGETRNAWKSPTLAALLTDAAARYLRALNIEVAH